MIKKFDIYLANLEPSFGAEPGISRPVVIIQPDALNETLPTIIVCPITTNIKKVPIIRIPVPASNVSGLFEDSDIMVDQLRSIDIKRIKKHLGKLNEVQAEQLLESLNILINE